MNSGTPAAGNEYTIGMAQTKLIVVRVRHVTHEAILKETALKPSMTRFLLLLAGTLLAIHATSSCAEEVKGALKKTQETGVFAVGYYENLFPFSYLDDNKVVIGYARDITYKIIDEIKQKLNLPNLKVKQVQITSQNRFAMVQNGVIDILCNTTTNNTERQKQFAFSNSIFIVGTRLMTRKDSGIKDFPDLIGKTVVTRAATTSEDLLRKLNSEKKYRMNIIATVDRAMSPLTVLQIGQAAAFMYDDVLLYGSIADSWRPDEWTVTGKPQSYEAYGCMMRKNDPELKKLVDAVIAKMMTSGEADILYKKWFMSPTPPKGLNLNFPMSEAMTKLFKHPNDTPFD